MTHKYLNTEFKPGASVFSDLENANANSATFTASAVNAAVKGGQVRMVKGKIALRIAADAEVCGEVCPAIVNESVVLEFNVKRGAASLAAMRAEVDRLFALAESEYGFTAGHVPPPQADFGV